MIRAEHIYKAFDGVSVLEDLSIHVPERAVYGLVGPNGAGKTTMIRHLAGIYRPDAGSITLCGEPVYENPSAKARIAYIPDDIYFFPQASIGDMMRFYRSVRGGFDMGRYAKLREVFGLDERRPMRRLSRGMQKQAAFWLAMSMRPEVLILDEPVDGLDPVMRRQVWSIVMGDAAEHGTTVLVSSHNLRELEDVCDHVGILNRGRLHIERSLSELQDNVAKIQLVLPDGTALPEGLDLLHESSAGRLRTLIIRGKAEETANRLAAAAPVFLDILPLSLEEIFIYELGGVDYAAKDIVL
jgi:ABC-2 type transport system ATP-binding protein